MSLDTIMAITLIGGLIVLLALGVEVAWSIGIMAAVGLFFFLREPLDEFAWRSWTTLNFFTLTAAPLFIFMGSLLSNTGVAERLIDAVEKWLGRLPGGLVQSVIGGNAIFAAMCGGSLAATAVFGRVVFPEMEKRGYDPGLALGSIASAAILSPLIPPSILMIIYGSWQGVSIISLFAGGVVPGLLLTLLFVLTVIVRVKLNPSLVPYPHKVSWRERITAAKEILPFAFVIVATLGVIFGGIMTPTEGASLGAFLSIILGLVYRRLNMAILKASIFDTVRVTSFAMFIMAMTVVLSHVFNAAGITAGVKDFVLGLKIGKYGVLIMLLALYLVMGTLFDSWSMLFLTFPFVMPIITAVNINLIWWGVIYVMAGEQSTVTPPFGLGLFVLHNVAPQHSIWTIARGTLPFLAAIYVNVLICTVFPQLILWLPSLIGR